MLYEVMGLEKLENLAEGFAAVVWDSLVKTKLMAFGYRYRDVSFGAPQEVCE